MKIDSLDRCIRVLSWVVALIGAYGISLFLDWGDCYFRWNHSGMTSVWRLDPPLGECRVRLSDGRIVPDRMVRVKDYAADKRQNSVVLVALYGHSPGKIYSAQIPGDLRHLAQSVGVYRAVWMPQQISASRASHLIGPLRDGLIKLQSSPDFYAAEEARELARFLAEYLAACEQNPDADVRVTQ